MNIKLFDFDKKRLLALAVNISVALILCMPVALIFKPSPAILVICAALSVILMVLFFRRRQFTPKSCLVAAGIILAAFIARLTLLELTPPGYTQTIDSWLTHLQKGGGLFALSGDLSAMSGPMLILALISHAGDDRLRLVGMVPIVFDFILAWFSMRLMLALSASRNKALATFALVLLLPVVPMASALTGLYDSVYAALVMACLFFALTGSPSRAMLSFGFAFAAGSPAFFLVPTLAILLLTSRIRQRNLLYAPAALFVCMMPSILLGRPVFDLLKLLFSPRSGFLQMTVPFGLHAFLGLPEPTATVVTGATAVLFFGAACVVIAMNIAKFDKFVLLLTSFIFSAAAPFLMPSVLAGSFFIALILSLIYAVVRPSRFYIPVLMAAATGAELYYVLIRRGMPDPRLFSILIAIAVAAACADLWRMLYPKPATVSAAGA